MYLGILDTPTNFEVDGSQNSLKRTISWTPPFTLDVTDLDPDITYHVCNNHTNTCVTPPIADASYAFSTTCFPVKFNVSACNPVGCSEVTSVQYPESELFYAYSKQIWMYQSV